MMLFVYLSSSLVGTLLSVSVTKISDIFLSGKLSGIFLSMNSSSSYKKKYVRLLSIEIRKHFWVVFWKIEVQRQMARLRACFNPVSFRKKLYFDDLEIRSRYVVKVMKNI